MRKIIFAIFVLAIVVFASCSKSTHEVKVYNQGINIIPMPAEISVKDGMFQLNKKTVFVVDSDSVAKIADFFAEKIKLSTGYDMIKKESANKNFISLVIDSSLDLKREGYKMSVDENHIEIVGKSAAGVFYGMQTLMQLLPAEIESSEIETDADWNVPCVEITDEPRFDYRGMHMDPSRHFVDVDFVKKQLDVFAMYKINTFHWHLTDDQGWRVEIKKYPKLTTVGATRIDGEGTEYGPYFYTQEQMKEIVEYAAERFITVIPELEVPGHELAAIAAYPWLSCTGDTVTPRIIWGVEDILMCPGKESTFDFLQDVIDEMVEIFPSEYFHIGGDECPKVYWEKCPLCQQRIKDEHLDQDPDHNPEECLQAYVVRRVEEMLAKHGRKIIGWDEILDGGVAPTATIMSWRGEDGGIQAAQKGHNVIMAPGGSLGLYIDHFEGDYKIEPVTIGGYSTVEKVYSFDPIPDTLKQLGLEKYIWGVQCNLWAEYLYSPEVREYRYYPRTMALSEIAWTPLEVKDYDDFCRRINNAYVRLDMHKMNYHIPQPEQPHGSCNFVAFVDSAVLEFTTSRPIKMVYTLDGTTPDMNSTEYTEPLVIKENTTLKIASVLVSGKMSKVREITVEKQEYSPAVELENCKAGLKMHNVAGMYLNTDELVAAQNHAERDTVISELIDLRSVRNFGERVHDYNNYASVAEGYVNIPEDGVYYFASNNDEVWIDGKLLISNKNETKRFSRNDKSVALAKGLHPIKVVFLSHIIGGWPSNWDDAGVAVRKSTDESFKKISGDMLFYKE